MRRRTFAATVLATTSIVARAQARSRFEAPPPMPGAGLRDPLQWPFLRASIWNRPIGTDAVYADTNWLGRIAAEVCDGFMCEGNFLFLDPHAPLKPVHYSIARYRDQFPERCNPQRWQARNCAFLPLADNYNTLYGFWDIGNGGNANSAIMINDSGEYVYDLSPISVCGSGSENFYTSKYPFHIPARRSTAWLKANKKASIFGDGRLGGQGATRLSSMGGTMRPDELMPGAHPIVDGVQTGPRHALKCSVNYALWYCSTSNVPPFGGPRYQWPAISGDNHGVPDQSVCAGVEESAYRAERSGWLAAIPRDAVLQLVPGLYDSLGELQTALVTTPAKMLAWTLQKFGMYQVEGQASADYKKFGIGGSFGPEIGDFTRNFYNAWGFRFGTSWNPEWGGEIGGVWHQDLVRVLQHCMIVEDNYPNSIGGAGERLTADAPPFDAGLIRDGVIREELVRAGEAAYS